MLRAALFALVLVSAPAAQAQSGVDVFAQIEGCWLGTFDGGEIEDERCITPMNGGRQWRDVHTVVGVGYGGETIYAWDADAGHIAVMYFANDGGLMRARGDVVLGGIDFSDARYVGADGQVQELRSRWRIPAGDRFEVVTERRENGEWRSFMRIEYRRASGPETAPH